MSTLRLLCVSVADAEMSGDVVRWPVKVFHNHPRPFGAIVRSRTRGGCCERRLDESIGHAFTYRVLRPLPFARNTIVARQGTKNQYARRLFRFEPKGELAE